jgi:ribosome-binding protein aMBF1 (putative translation factor)
MKKTFCDRCSKECDGSAVQRFTIFDVNRSIDVCDDCYREFFKWLNEKQEEK